MADIKLTNFTEDDILHFSINYTFKDFKLSSLTEKQNSKVTLKISLKHDYKFIEENNLSEIIDKVKSKAKNYKDALLLLAKYVKTIFTPSDATFTIKVENETDYDKEYTLTYSFFPIEDDLDDFNPFTKINTQEKLDNYLEDYLGELYDEDKSKAIDTSHLRLIKPNEETKKDKKNKKNKKKKNKD